MFQEGRIRSFGSQVSWLLSFPQGAANVWAWTMFFTGNTVLFRAVQLVFGVQLLLATWLLARRSGASEVAAALAVFIISTTALFYIIVTTCNDDIGNAAAIITMLAFLAPPQAVGKGQLQRDLAAACLALSEACLIKVPFVAVLFAIGALAGLIWTRLRTSDWQQRMGAAVRAPALWVTSGVLVVSCYPYFLNAISTGNPISPILVSIGSHVVFSGDMLPKNFGPGTNPFPTGMSLPARWTEVFADWYVPMTVDSLGTAGPIYPMVVLFWAVVAISDGVKRRDRWTIVLGCLAGSMFAVPEAWLPRYGLPWLSVWTVLASLSFTAVSDNIRSLPLAIVIIAAVSSMSQLENIHDSYLWLKSNSSPWAWYDDRGRSVPEHYDLDRSLAPSAALVHAIRTNVGKDTVLAWCVNAYPYLLWNINFTNRIEYLDGCNACPPCGLSDTNARVVYQSIVAKQPDWLLLYSTSPLARRLIDSPALQYVPFFGDMRTGLPADKFNMILFRHGARS